MCGAMTSNACLGILRHGTILPARLPLPRHRRPCRNICHLLRLVLRLRNRHPTGDRQMRKTPWITAASTLALVGALAGCAGFAPPPGNGYGPAAGGPGNAPPPAYRDHFTARQRAFAHRYYGNGNGREHGHGHEHGEGERNCPPGLARKHNGCMPPGQAKKWDIGQPLPGDVNTYPIPQAVYQGLGAPPPGYRYVRVMNDILLVTTGTNMVVDAIKDISRN